MCVYRADLEAECEWLYSNDRYNASAEVREAKLKRYGDLCSQGDSFGQALLGFCYYYGWGVSRDWMCVTIMDMESQRTAIWPDSGSGGLQLKVMRRPNMI